MPQGCFGAPHIQQCGSYVTDAMVTVHNSCSWYTHIGIVHAIELYAGAVSQYQTVQIIKSASLGSY